jgi:hypothetical protein
MVFDMLGCPDLRYPCELLAPHGQRLACFRQSYDDVV